MKFLGLLLVLLTWATGAFILKKWPNARSMSMSQHAASNPAAVKLFGAVLIGGGLIFYAWLVKWFVPTLDLTILFIVLVTGTLLTQIIAALIPDISGWSSKIHRASAYSGAFLYLPISYLILAAPKISIPARVIGLVCFAYMITACLAYFFVKRARDHYLVFQVLYIMAFQVIILAAAYLS